MSEAADLEIVDDAHGVVIRRVVVGPLDTNCWILHGTDSTNALLIDPGDEPTRILDAVGDLSVTAIVLTHSHWDHVLAVPGVVDALGCDVFMHPDDNPVWPHELDHLQRVGHFDAGTATDELLACGCSLGFPPGTAPWTGATRALHHGQHLTFGNDRTAQADGDLTNNHRLRILLAGASHTNLRNQSRVWVDARSDSRGRTSSTRCQPPKEQTCHPFVVNTEASR